VTETLYITAMEPQSGKSIVSLGFMETLSARADRVGFFRPIVPSRQVPDAQVELIRHRYQLDATYEEMQALSVDEAGALIAAGRSEELVRRVFEAYKRLEQRFDMLLCEGTDFTGGSPALDFDLNAEIANQLGCPVLVVVKGSSVGAIAASVRVARESLQRRGCELFGVIVNRVPAAALQELRRHSVTYDRREPMYVLAENPSLANPTVAEVADELGADVLYDAGGTMQREVREVRVAAMSVEHFIEDLVDGTLVIVPADRPEILIASLVVTRSADLGTVAGIVLTGGYSVGPTIGRLLAKAPFPVLAVKTRTYLAANVVHDVRPTIRADDERKIATALGVFETGVDGAEIQHRFSLPRRARTTPLMFEFELSERAKAYPRRIVLPEGEDDRVLRAADVLTRRGVVQVTILGPPDTVRAHAAALGADIDGAQIVDPVTSPLRAEYANSYWELRKHKGMTEEAALDALADPNYFGTSMVAAGACDGMVSGAVHTTADTIRPAFEIIRPSPGVSVVSSVFFMCLADRVLVYGDCAVNPKPTSEQLADIAISSAQTAARFGVEPRIAMLSYSTGQSGRGEDVDTVRRATEIVREREPDLKVEGPIQYDAAVDADVAQLKMPESDVAGRATVFIFPDLEAGNVAYKAVQRSAGAVAVGPVLQGLRKPVNDLSRGCSMTDIVNTVAITAIQAQGPATAVRAADGSPGAGLRIGG
jgi:phosphate acetyltransferase